MDASNAATTKPRDPAAEAHRRTCAMCVTMLAETWNRKISPPMLEAYRIGLSDVPPDAVERATAAALRTCQFMPSPAELRELSGEVRAADRAELAWLAFSRALATHGPYRSLDFADASINAVVRSLGGLEAVAETPGDEFDTFLRARFLKAYIAIDRSGVGGEATAPLLGFFDRINQVSSLPVRIACGPLDTDRARLAGRQPVDVVPRVTFQRVEGD